MTKQIADLAFSGNWESLLPILRRNPTLINSLSEHKGYTVLHQAAWHGASLSVFGELLALGADRGLKTQTKKQTACDIAIEKHAGREDLKYILAPGSRSLAQLIRKAVAETPDLFGDYDGNQIICDRLVECFGSDTFCHSTEELNARMDAAFIAVTGVSLSLPVAITCGPTDSFSMEADTRFWNDRFLPILRELTVRSHFIPIEKKWAVIADLFYPAPNRWGLRGDLFLWLEMRQALCHVGVPETSDDLVRILSAAFTSLTCEAMENAREFSVPRFSRGGMSGGWISSQFWSVDFIPMMQQRLVWLRETWPR
jgi:hypothetical protein